MLPGSGISTARQLAGKTIAVNALGSVAQLLVSSALSAQGVSPSSVHFVAMGFPAMPAALQKHRIDAAYLVEPYLSQAEEQTGGEELLDVNSGATQDFPINGFAATVQWCQKYPKTAAAVARALDEGQAMAAADRTAGADGTCCTTRRSASRSRPSWPSVPSRPPSTALHLQRVPDPWLNFQRGHTDFRVA